jgi:GrpB-like predicted nucleotidyltransferase (UPF0157 family)
VIALVRKIAVIPYDKSGHELFKLEKERLAEILGEQAPFNTSYW